MIGTRAGRLAVIAGRLAAAAMVLSVGWPAAAADGPLRVRNVAPATLLFGLPRPVGALLEAGTTEATMNLEHANNFTAGGRGAAAASFDGATTVASLGLRRRFHDRLEWGLELPLVRHDGGFTDGFIDGFHDLFGFPDGGRDAAPRNRLDYRLDYGGAPVARVDDHVSHLGDVRGWLGYRLHGGAHRELVVRGMIKLPTGRVDSLSGSEATDVSAWLEVTERGWLEDMGVVVTLMGGVTVPGDGELGGLGQRDAVGFAHVGLHYPLTRGITLHAQLDGHSDVLDAGVSQLAAAGLQGSLGGTVRLSRSTWVDLAVQEDLSTRSVPDVVFQVMFGARL